MRPRKWTGCPKGCGSHHECGIDVPNRDGHAESTWGIPELIRRGQERWRRMREAA